jgi:hypothetical protein
MAGRSVQFAVLGIASVVAAVVVANGKSDGLPVLGIDVGSTGVTTRSASSRYVTVPAKGHTVVERVRRNGGQIRAARVLPGHFTIPAVAYDGSAGGLSADGRLLVLIEPRAQFPRARTTLAILEARALRVRTILDLRGDFSFDAISPNGGLLYLIQYVSPRDPTRYLVRAYDTRRGRLLAEPIVDPHESGSKMRGNPLSRATSPDGRWAYTLYDGAAGAPFIHALDTIGRTAHCIDLDALAGSLYLSRLRLRLDGGTLSIRDGGEAELIVDTKTFVVRKPAKPSARSASRHGSGSSWQLVGWAAFGTLVASGSLLLARRRHRRPAFGR